MEENENLEQRIKLTYETNADEVGQEVQVLSENMENVNDAAQKNSQITKTQEAIHKSFKTQLKEANEFLRKQIQIYGETSTEAVQAAKAVADLRDQMQFATDLVDNFDPDQKFKALGAATQIAATGTSAIVSGMALLGDESEDTTKRLLKVQAAMSFADSIKGLSGLQDQFNVFKTVVADGFNAIVAARRRELAATTQQTVAQRILNATMLMNPYVLITAAVVALGVATYAWIKYSQEAEARQKALADAINLSAAATDKLKESTKQYNDEQKASNELDVLRAKSLGASDEAIQRLIKTQNQLTTSDAIKKEAEAYKNLEKAQDNLHKAYIENDEDLIESAKKAKEQAYDFWRQATEARTNAINDGIKNELQATIDHNKKMEDLAKEAAAKAKAAREKRLREEEEARQKQYEMDQAWLKLKNDQEKAFLDEIDAAKKAFEDRQKTDEQKKIDDENLRYEEQLRKAKEFNKSTEEIELEHLNILNDIRLEKQKEQQETWQAMEDAKLAYKKELTDAELNLAEKGAGFLTAIAGKNKTLQKAAIIADAGVQIAKMIAANNAANIGALATPQAIATSGASAAPVIAMNNVSTALGVGATIAAQAKALQAVGAGGGGGGASSGGGQTPTPGSGAGSGSAAPQVTFQASSENQIANSMSRQINEQQPLHAFVVAAEISTAQELEDNAIQANSI